MTLRIRAARRATAQPDPQQSVHFHLEADGRAYVCDRNRRDSPSLSVEEVGSRTRAVRA